MLRRLGFFFLTNILVVVTISLLLNILGVKPYLTRSGIDYYNLMIFCLVWGMGGAFISLALSRQMAKWMMGVQLIGPNAGGTEGWLVQTTHQLARSANLPAMPEVGIFDSPEPNAFATGPTKSRSLVAVSTGLLSSMSQEEVKGVLAHEITHIENGDMVTMVLIQGVVNAFVMFLARVIAFAVSQNAKEENRSSINWIVTMVCEIVIGILGVMVVAWFSRQREFRADRGGAKLAGAGAMAGALEKLQIMQGRNHMMIQARGAASMEPLQISGHKKSLGSLFATHPPLEERIARLKSYH